MRFYIKDGEMVLDEVDYNYYQRISNATDLKELNDASLSRFFYHFSRVRKEDTSLGIATYFDLPDPEGIKDKTSAQQQEQQESADKNNKEKRFKFLNDLKSMGLGNYTEMYGHIGNPDYNSDDKTSKITSGTEFSFFIINITIDQISAIASRYDQKGFIYYGPESDFQLSLYGRLPEGSYNLVKSWKNISPEKIREYYSILKGKTMYFEEKLIGKESFYRKNRSWITGE